MSWRNVLLIFRREAIDQSRDRRTLFMVAVLPLLLYPALGIGMLQLMLLFQEQPRTIAVVHADRLPEPAWLADDQIVARWFRRPEDADKLRVISEQVIAQQRQPKSDALQAQFALCQEVAKLAMALNPQQRLTADSQTVRLSTVVDLTEQEDALVAQFAQCDVPVLVVVPADFPEQIAARRQLLQRDSGGPKSTQPVARLLVIHNSANENSLIAYNRVMDSLARWERELLATELAAAGLPADLPTPVDPLPFDLAAAEEISANVWSKLFPALLVLMSLTGAFYPAIDLCAGEKERGTMETLLICPASRTELVLGKFFTVFAFSLATALLNMSSLGMTGQYMASLAGNGPMSRMGDISFPPLSSLVWIIALLIPLAALFSGLCLALATFAKSTKEGQYYLTPLLMVTLGLVVFCISPAVQIEPFYSVLPVAGPALLLKGLLKGGAEAAELSVYLAPVLLTSFGYSILALWWAIDQFSREEVLFREAERFDIRLWLRHLLRDKEAVPTFSEGAACFVLIMLLQFAAIKFLRAPLELAATPAALSLALLQLLIVQQMVVIATPALLMGIMLTTSVVQTFRLRWPGGGMALTAVVLALCLHPLTIELARSLQWFFPALPPEIAKIAGMMSAKDQPTWLVLLAFAVAPGICEELAFRGFLLSGFLRSGRTGLAVVLSALAFGIMHLIPQQVFNAALLGLLLGWMAVHSRSLLPPILFHITYNGTEVLRNRLGSQLPTEGTWGLLWRMNDGDLRYQPTLLLLAACTATLLIGWRLLLHSGSSPSVLPQIPPSEPYPS